MQALNNATKGGDSDGGNVPETKEQVAVKLQKRWKIARYKAR